MSPLWASSKEASCTADDGGSFTLTFGGDTTSGIAYNASASTVQAALAGLGSIGSGNVSVVGSAGGPYTICFTGSLAGEYQEYQAPITTASSLTGGTSPAISDAVSGSSEGTFTEYNSAGLPILSADSDAVILPASLSTLEQYPDLLDNTGSYTTTPAYVYLAANAGEITTTEYYGSTTADTTTAGEVEGYVEKTSIQLGQSGTAIPQEYEDYIALNSSGPIVYEVADDTLYGDTGSGDARTTSYSYTCYPGTTQIEQVVETLPGISTDQNGPGTGSPDTITTVYDIFGRPIWTKDGNGSISYTAYNDGTGAVVEQITDVNTADTSDFTDLPSGWSTPAGYGLNLVTTYLVDPLGRTTETIDPDADATITVYDDANLETRTYTGRTVSGTATSTGSTTTLVDTSLPATVDGYYVGYTLTITGGTDSGHTATVTGYTASSHTLTFSSAFPSATTSSSTFVLWSQTGPAQISLTYLPAANSTGLLYNETMTSSAAAHLTDGLPDGTETLSSANIQSLERDFTNAAGQVITSDSYVSLSGATFSEGVSGNDLDGVPTADLGTSGANFWRSTYAYDSDGRQNVVIEPTGTIDRTIFDGFGDVISQWVGTDDTPSSGYWSPTNNTSPSNMIDVEDDYYDTQAAPAVPTLTSVALSGAAAETYFVEITYVINGIESAPSMETSIAVTSGHTLEITAPTAVPGASGYNVYVSTTTDDETLQNGGTPVAFTTNWSPGGTITTSGTTPPSGDVGDVDVSIQHPGDGAADRISVTAFDWQGNQVLSESGLVTTSNSTPRSITYDYYDNQGENTQEDQYDGTGDELAAVGFTDGVPNAPSSTLLAKTTTAYDDQGRVYEADVYSVTSGTATSGLITNTFYDHDGNVIAVYCTGQPTMKYAYDGDDRVTAAYTTDGGAVNNSGTPLMSWSDAGSVTDDIVVTETDTTYDPDGNAILTVTKERLSTDSNSATGALGGPSTSPDSSNNYVTDYYDAAGRLVAEVNYGTTSESAPGPYDAVPTPSDSALVTSYSYLADNVQTLTITGTPTGGSFTLTFGGDTTSGIAFNASASTVQADLAALGSIGSGNVSVIGNSGGPYTIRFIGTLAGEYQSPITHASSLTGGTSPAISDVVAIPGGDAGMQQFSTDPRGIVTASDFDMLGDTLDTIDAFTDGVPTDDTDQITAYTYDGNGDVLTQTAVMPAGQNSQTTAYVYGVGGTIGTNLFSNDLIATTEYPDPSTGAASTSASNDVSQTYDNLGETLTMTDQNDTAHTYSYNSLGQMTLDSVTTLGSDVDGTILALGYGYTALGLPYQQTSYSDSSGTTVLNQDQDVYNGLQQIIGEFQETSGAVDTSTTPEIQYVYSSLSTGSLPTEMIYPNGRILHFGYDNSALDTAIGRIDYLADDNGSGSVGSHLVDYTYQGLDTFVGQVYGNGVDETTTLDAFGDIAEMNYAQSGTSTDDFQYGYDRDGNVLYMDNMTTGGSSFSELFHANSTTSGDDNTAYDPLGRLADFTRGTLSSSGNNGSTLDTVSTANSLAGSSQSWSLDAIGNQNSVTTDGTTTDNTQNSQNELTGVGSSTLTYDNDGNMTTDQNGNVLTYDAWNRLVTDSNLTTNHETLYGYDANGRQISDEDTAIANEGPILVINNGSAQRSMVDSLTVVFDHPVTLASGAVGLVGATNGTMTIYVSNPSGDDKTFLITFSGGSIVNGSLPNDVYTLTLYAADITNVSGGGDTLSSNQTFVFHRLFGDINGDGAVDGTDYTAFEATFGLKSTDPGYDPAFDYFGTGKINASDYLEFAADDGTTLSYTPEGRILAGVSTTAADASDISSWTPDPIQTRYFDTQGQVLEEHEAGTVTAQNVWSIDYVNDLVLRDDNSTSGSYGITGSGLGTRTYYQHDANFDVTAAVDTGGNVLQRYVYSPYGVQAVLTADWGSSGEANSVYGFQGGRYDGATGMNHFGARDYSPSLGVWIEPDPAGYEFGGANEYQLEISDPAGTADPTGLADGPVPPTGPQKDDRFQPGNAEDQYRGIQNAQDKQNRNRPSIEDENDPWEGVKKRPKQNNIRSTDKSRRRADRENQSERSTCPDPSPAPLSPDWIRQHAPMLLTRPKPQPLSPEWWWQLNQQRSPWMAPIYSGPAFYSDPAPVLVIPRAPAKVPTQEQDGPGFFNNIYRWIQKAPNMLPPIIPDIFEQFTRPMSQRQQEMATTDEATCSVEDA